MDEKVNKVRFDRLLAVVGVVCVMIAAVVYGLQYRADSSGKEEAGIYDIATDGSGREETAVTEKTPEAVEETAKSEAVRVSVFVCGAVMVPDVYELESGALVKDAVYAAGGFSEEADVSYWNLAQKVSDGEKIYIPTMDEAAGGSVQAGQPGEAGEDTGCEDAGADSKVNINTATLAQLKTLPGIGDAKAEAVIAYREAHGGFQSVEEIMQVSGIKEALYSKIKDYIII